VRLITNGEYSTLVFVLETKPHKKEKRHSLYVRDIFSSLFSLLWFVLIFSLLRLSDCHLCLLLHFGNPIFSFPVLSSPSGCKIVVTGKKWKGKAGSRNNCSVGAEVRKKQQQKKQEEESVFIFFSKEKKKKKRTTT